MRNPRKHLPPEKYCIHIYPEEHPREGERCGAIKMRNSNFCYFHQPNQDIVLSQLAEARKKAKGANVKHGLFSAKAYTKCDECALADICDYYEKGKNVCDFQLTRKVDLSALDKIQTLAEEVIQTEFKRNRKLEIFFKGEFDNPEVFEVSSRCNKRLMSMLKDFAGIKELYEKRKKPDGWREILKNRKD